MKQQNAMDFIYWEGTEGQREKKRGKRKNKGEKKELEREMRVKLYRTNIAVSYRSETI